MFQDCPIELANECRASAHRDILPLGGRQSLSGQSGPS
jgi:hypothetical protein